MHVCVCVRACVMNRAVKAASCSDGDILVSTADEAGVAENFLFVLLYVCVCVCACMNACMHACMHVCVCVRQL